MLLCSGCHGDLTWHPNGDRTGHEQTVAPPPPLPLLSNLTICSSLLLSSSTHPLLPSSRPPLLSPSSLHLSVHYLFLLSTQIDQNGDLRVTPPAMRSVCWCQAPHQRHHIHQESAQRRRSTTARWRGTIESHYNLKPIMCLYVQCMWVDMWVSRIYSRVSTSNTVRNSFLPQRRHFPVLRYRSKHLPWQIKHRKQSVLQVEDTLI